MEIQAPKYNHLDSIINSLLNTNDSSILGKLTPDEKAIAWDILEQLRDSGEYSWLKQLWQLDYEIEPPTVERFFNDPYYFKHVGDDLYPKWKEQLSIILDPIQNIHEVVFRGCIGSGKTYVGAAITCYDLAMMMHMKNPQKTFKLSQANEANFNSPIYYGLISSDLTQLEKMLWAYTLTMMKRSPFFRKFSKIKDERGYKELHLPLPKNVHLVGGSLPAHILGLNLYGACLDESNYRRGADPQQDAFDFYLKLRNRIENRFIRSSNKGRIILISSEGNEGSFLDNHCRQLQSSPEIDDVHICRFSEWEIKGHTMELGSDTFRVDIGDKLRMPKILEEDETPRDGAQIVIVPEVYRRAANRNLSEFLKECAGITPGRANKFFYSVQELLDSFTLENPALVEVAECALDTEYNIQDYFDTSKMLIKIKGIYHPLVHPEARRFLHVDLAKSEDNAGISMFHIGDYSEGGSPIFYQDFAMALRASASKPIDYDKIILFIRWLKQMNYSIGLISYDSYQSQHSLNILDGEGFNVKIRSLDYLKVTPRGKVQTHYYEFRTVVHEGRIRLVKSDLLRRESIELLDIEGKPDHPESGSKDVIDATVGAVSNAIELLGNTSRQGDFFNFGNRGDIGVLDGFNPLIPITEKQLYGKNCNPENVFINP